MLFKYPLLVLAAYGNGANKTDSVLMAGVYGDFCKACAHIFGAAQSEQGKRFFKGSFLRLIGRNSDF